MEISDRHYTGIHGDDIVVKTYVTVFVFGGQNGLETAVSVAGRDKHGSTLHLNYKQFGCLVPASTTDLLLEPNAKSIVCK
ncbi:hypothetical protein PS720_00381 [Pseudomonas fluorescens]|nr:hypothetical protein PS720_00381 [Pseudomonas fluorescens]